MMVRNIMLFRAVTGYKAWIPRKSPTIYSSRPLKHQLQGDEVTPIPTIRNLVKNIDTTFADVSQTVFKNKTGHELRRALFVLWLCSSETLIKHNQKIMSISRNIFGRYFYQRFMNATFYGQFVIGQNEHSVRPIIENYWRLGVGPILYYALEEDKSENASLSNDPFYAANVESFKDAIDITSRATNGRGFIAVKPTALCSPDLWVRLTNVILERTADVSDCVYHSQSDLVGHLDQLSIDNLSEYETDELRKLVRRAEDVIEYARDTGVKVMIDAEQTYFQPAIQRILGVEMMRRFNKQSVTVLVTYQTYLKGACDNIVRDMEYCRAENIRFGARIVRGAYLDQERTLAVHNEYEDPTNPTFETTTEMYHQTADHVLKELKSRGEGHVEVMFATHNEETLRYIMSLLTRENPPLKSISLGQLYGMCDHISFHLGEVGIPVYKSMPYGPIELVTSYLGRRAIENRGALEKVQKERRLLAREMLNRLRRK